MTASQTPTGHQLRMRPRSDGFSDNGRGLLDTVVGSFASDHYVVHMALAQPRAADAYETRVLLQLADGATAGVSHAALYSAHQLVHDHADRAAIGNAALDTFRHQLGETVPLRTIVGGENLHGGIGIGGLEVAVAGALCHGSQRAHAPVCLEGAALIENSLPRAFFRAGQQRTDHHATGAGGNG